VRGAWHTVAIAGPLPGTMIRLWRRCLLLILTVLRRYTRRLSWRLEIVWDIIRSLWTWRWSASPIVPLASCTRLSLLRHVLRTQWPLTVLGIIVVAPIVQILRRLGRRRYSRESLRMRESHARIGTVSLLLRCYSSPLRTLLWSIVPLIMVFRDAVVVVLLTSGAVLGIIVTHLRMPVADEMRTCARWLCNAMLRGA